jgi:hypothetical protein
MSFLDASTGGGLDGATAAEMARLLRAAADVVEALSTCDDVDGRLVFWRQLADAMAEFDALLPGVPEP